MILRLSNRQRAVRFSLSRIRNLLDAALPHCLDAALPGAPLPALGLIEISILTDAAIARVHDRFLDDPAPTDVITFEHGEILLGAETIAGQAPAFGHGPDEEAALCAIHGLLHLAGHDDRDPRSARRMRARQGAIWRATIARGCPPVSG